MATATDIRVLVPRVRRALDVTPEQLSDDDTKDLVADAIADIILYSGGLFGKDLTVAERDAADVPIEYTTSDELTLPEGSLIASQAALNWFFHRFNEASVSERIGDEAVVWERQKSASLLRDQFKLLIDQRDAAIAQIVDAGAALDSYVSFLEVRDAYTAALIEPWTQPGAAGLEVDYRFQ